MPHRAVIEGDGTSAAIAAASVIAKVTRDRYMHGAAGEHPGWGFEEHVGYSTPEHREAIERIGISPLHRRSFQSVAYSPACELRRLEGAFDVLVVGDAAGAVEGDADGVEADLVVARAGRGGARPSRRWRGGGRGAACGGRSRGPGARGRSRRPRARP